MPDTRISILTAASSVGAADQLPIVQSGENKVATATQLMATGAPVTASAYKLNSSGIITDATTTRTLSAGDNGKVIYFTSASAITLTLADSLGAGFSCTVIQGAAGQITFAAGGQSMTIVGGLTKTSGVAAYAAITAPVANTFFIGGSLA